MKRHSISLIIVLSFIAGALSCSDETLFETLPTTESGINFSNDLVETDDFNIIDYLYFFNGGGVSVGDINQDGLPDIFFSGNQVKNQLYLNKGNLHFEDISKSAGVQGNSSWNTGSVMGDFNGDGLLDIYVCAVVGVKGMIGHNELFINNGDNTFSERSGEFNLDFESFSSSAALLDYDLDGDLDLYLLNHAIHSQESFGKAELRYNRTYETGDKLLRNDGNTFTDVSESAGIFGGVNGYGLGLAIGDTNQDGYPDIFVGNDFHEDDYLYLNNGDGTFTESLRKSFTHTSRFTMGADFADVNNDGYPDLISLDMLPDEENVLKKSDGDERLEILELRTSRYGYYYQFSRNMLQLNNGDGTFSETALMSGVAATDWSWGALFSDFDLDGNQDLFISNGIPRRPNDLDYIRFVSSEQVKKTINSTKLVDKEALEMMPTGEAINRVFSGNGDGTFINQSDKWLESKTSYSTASALGDLDLDGDIDIVVNNINAPATLYINQKTEQSNYLSLQLEYAKQNKFGIGAKVYAYQREKMQYQELYLLRGFQASSEPLINFGFSSAQPIDSIIIVWPDRYSQKLINVGVNQRLTITYKQEESISMSVRNYNDRLFRKVNSDSLGLSFQHKEDTYSDFKRQLLLPFKQSDKGPGTGVGDLNGDGLQDVFFGGSKREPGVIYFQENDQFNKMLISQLLNDSIDENTEIVLTDFNGDKKTDVFIGNGGSDFYNQSKQLLDKLYLQGDSLRFQKVGVSAKFENTSCIKYFDFNNDGFLDVFIGSESTPNDYGKIPASLFLINKDGNLKPFQEDVFSSLGMVTDAAWSDYNSDGLTDLIVVGNWMGPTFLKNEGQSFVVDKKMSSLNGLWQCIEPFDVDGDGDEDFVLGNWGLNSKFQASIDEPLKMFYGDLDKNGSTESILTISKEGQDFPIAGLDLLSQQLISLRKKFTSYESFAGKTINQILEKPITDHATILIVNELRSGYLINENGSFNFKPFNNNLQVAPILELLAYDFDNDNSKELLFAGNYFGVQPYHGRFGSFGGMILQSGGKTIQGSELGLKLFNKSVRALNILEIANQPFLMVTIHNDTVQLYKLLSY